MPCMNFKLDTLLRCLRNFNRKQQQQITTTTNKNIKWVATSENVPSVMCAQRRFRSACAFAQSDQNLHCAHFWKTRMKRFFTLTTLTLIRCVDSQADLTLRKHAYSNILKILPPKIIKKKSDKKFWYFSCFCSKHRLWAFVWTASAKRF